MTWHQILGNGLQSTVLTLIAVMLALVLTEEAILTVAVIARTTGTATLLRTASTAFLLGVHFICNLKAVTVGTVLFVPISEHLGHSFKFQIYV